MCGIVGYISQNDNLYKGPKDHFMRYALALDTLRGADSTGLVTLSKRFTVKSMKTLMPGDVFVHSNEYLKKYKTGWAQFGHNRAATKGSITEENAHPFTFGAVTMVHNGTLLNGGKSLPTFDPKIGDVDSMQIAYALSQYDPEDAADVLKEIEGSFALVWADSRDESINMARNSQRPLHFTFNSKKTVLWYMSDGHHLHSINKSFGNHECKGTGIFELDRFKILKFRKGSTAPEVAKFNPFISVVRRQEAKKEVGPQTTTKTHTQSGGQNNSAQKRNGPINLGKEEKGKSTTTRPASGSLSDVRIELGGKTRRIPACMQHTLREEFDLTPSDLLQFQPDDAIQLSNGNYVVYGVVLHEPWGNVPFDMTLHNVKKAQWRAYKDYDWVVRPIGVCPPSEFDPKTGGVLGHLVHCEWDKYARAQTAGSYGKESSDDEKEDDSAGDTVVRGPGGVMTGWDTLKLLLNGACINCGDGLLEGDVEKMQFANDRRDLICEDCVIELKDWTNSHTTN